MSSAVSASNADSMSNADLHVSGSVPGTLSLKLHVDDRPEYAVKVEIEQHMEELVDASPSTKRRLLVEPIQRNLRQWILDSPGERVLAIHSESAELDSIPWEGPLAGLLPSVVRILRGAGTPPPPSQQSLRVVAAGWPSVPGLKLPGIESELNSLAELSQQGLEVRVLTDPTVKEFQDECTSFSPDILHLIPPAIRPPKPEFLISRDDDREWRDPLDFVLTAAEPQAAVLASPATTYSDRVQLVVVNSCDSGGGHLGQSAAHAIANALNAAAFGWLGKVDDQAAADFAPFFLSRLLEGNSIIEALRAYSATAGAVQTGAAQWPSAKEISASRALYFGKKRNPVAPVLWSPALDLLTRPLHSPPSPTPSPSPMRGGGRGAMRGGGRPRDDEPPKGSLPRVDVVLEPMRFLNPALLKNDYPAIPRLILASDEAHEDIGLAIHCDTGVGTSTVRQTLKLQKGRQPVPAIDSVQFPILYELIDGAVDRRQINFTVTCTYREQVISEKTQSVLWMGCTEWLDKPETWAYIPAFVNPYEEGVLDVLDKSDEVLKRLGNSTSSFSGYQEESTDFVERQVEAIFKTLRDKPFELSYINPPPIPVYAPSDELASGQRVRTPTKVIERKRGTCHDLAVLVASCLEHIGIYPLVILISGHTFVGFWLSSAKHATYWDKVRNNVLGAPNVGDLWTISKRKHLEDLVETGQVRLLEATEVTNRQSDLEKAFDAAKEKLAKTARFDAAIDIQASRMQIQPL